MRLELRAKSRFHDTNSLVAELQEFTVRTPMFSEGKRFTVVFDSSELLFIGCTDEEPLSLALKHQTSPESAVIVNSPDTVSGCLSLIRHLESSGLVSRYRTLNGTILRLVVGSEVLAYISVET